MLELAQAWDAALDARPEDQGPWRVLADVLLSLGFEQGELMHLELDLELGPLRGLARGRHSELRMALPRLVAPQGLTLKVAFVHRGALLECRADAAELTGPADDPRWHSLQRLWLHFPTQAAVPRTPLAGSTLRRVESLGLLTPAALDVLLEGPPRAHLAGLAMLARHPEGAARWERRWSALFATHPRLRRLSFTAESWEDERQSAPPVDDWLDPLVGAALDEVTVAVAPSHLPALAAWRRRTAPAFALVATLGGPLPPIEVLPDALVLRTADTPRPEDLASAERLLRSVWPTQPPPLRWRVLKAPTAPRALRPG
ncbi:MAG: hypothetical protein AB1938_14055 [Myxococcota bacterium]